MILITLSTFLNVFVVNLSFYGARAPVPKLLKSVSKLIGKEKLFDEHVHAGPANSQHCHNVEMSMRRWNDVDAKLFLNISRETLEVIFPSMISKTDGKHP